jgi:hypothetical protein
MGVDMGKYDAERAQLREWKNASTKLYLESDGGGLVAWCVGRLTDVSDAVLHFGVDGMDRGDLLFGINVHDAHFSFLGKCESIAPPNAGHNFGLALQILLLPGKKGSSKVVLAELLGKLVERSPSTHCRFTGSRFADGVRSFKS